MAYKYYFLNGDKGKGKALFLEENGVIRRDFNDISNIDLITLNMKKKDLRDIINEYNKGEDLSGYFYDASYPHCIDKVKKGEILLPKTEVYPAFFDFSSERTEYYIDKLKEFAEERKYKVENGMLKHLDDTPDFNLFIENLLYRIFDEFDSRITGYDSLLAHKLKEIINERFDDYKEKDNSQYVKFRLKTIKNILTNYTQLRLLVMEYLCIKEDYNPNMRGTMNKIGSFINDDMTPCIKDPSKKLEYRQLVLSDFLDI